MFSATWPKEIQALASRFCCIDPIHIKIGDQQGHDGFTVNENITQKIHVIDDFKKKRAHFQQLLISLVHDNGKKPLKIIIFCKTKKGCDNLEKTLKWDKDLQNAIPYESCAIHGDKEQWERDGIYSNFKKPITNKTNILIATDVASRGLDVKDITVVINYDMPMSGFDNYVHRIGRTGRAGAKGIAHSYIVPSEDKSMVGPLIALLKKTK